MTEKELQLLGFERRIDEESGIYYFVYKVTKGLDLITNCNDDLINNEWHVTILQAPSLFFNNFGEMQGLINQLNKAKK